jgi:hypothetical protein
MTLQSLDPDIEIPHIPKAITVGHPNWLHRTLRLKLLERSPAIVRGFRSRQESEGLDA